MIYPEFFNYTTAALLTGLCLMASHYLALTKAASTQEWLRGFPRSKSAGMVLCSIAAVWAWLLVKTMDLGEFSNWQTRILVFIPVAWFLTVKYVEEFLAVRALGMLALLAAEPVLEAAWLRPESGRLLLVILAYAWVVLGMFWVGMPYTLRDQISWATRTPSRWKALAMSGLAYGAVLVIHCLIPHH